MLSIIIPTLNEEELLPILLKEIKKQNFNEGLEVIIADAGSTDRTVKIAQDFGCKVVKGGLPPKGRNEGAKVAQGDYLLFLDADNTFLPDNFLATLLKEFKERKLDSASFPIYPDGNRFDRLAYGVYNWWVDISQKFLPHATNAILIKKEIHQKLGGFDERVKIAEDHDYARRSKKYGKFGFIKTEPVLTSPRRFERDGRLKTYCKYLLAAAWMMFFGSIKSNIFKYRFNSLKKK